MEIKIICPCGQKYKFDVEPLNGAMPWAVKCPVCSADGTAAANLFIQQSAPPVATEASSTAPDPSAPGGKLRVKVSAPPAEEEAASESHTSKREVPRAYGPQPVEKSSSWKTWIWIAVVVVFVLYAFTSKWGRRLKFTEKIAAMLGVGSVDSSDSASGKKMVLPDDNGVMLLARHTNAMEVAEACAEFWKQKTGRNLKIVETTEDDGGDGTVLIVHPVHQGTVQISGPLSWDQEAEARFTGTAQYVSKKLNIMTVHALMGDDADSGDFAVYDKGDRKFWCRQTYLIKDGDLKENVKLEGEEWAKGTGYKVGEEGYKAFTMYDADNLVQKIGFVSQPEKPQGKYLGLVDPKPAK